LTEKGVESLTNLDNRKHRVTCDWE